MQKFSLVDEGMFGNKVYVLRIASSIISMLREGVKKTGKKR